MPKRHLRLLTSKPDKTNYDLSLIASAITAVAPADNVPTGQSWDVTIMKAGVVNANIRAYVTIDSLKASIPAFEGASVYSVFEGDAGGHKKDRSKKVTREIVGILENPRVEGDELRATFSIMPSEGWLRDNLVFLASKNQLQHYQLSVDSAIDTESRYVPEVGSKMLVMRRIVKADLDIVREAAAGGKFNRMVASNHSSNEGDSTMKDKLLMLFTMLFPTLLAAKGVDPVLANENELYTHLLQAGKGIIPDSIPEGTPLTEGVLDTIVTACRTKILQAASTQTPAKPNSDGNAGNVEQLLQAAFKPYETQIAQLKLQASHALVSAKLADSKLPAHVRTKLQTRLQASVQTEAQIDAEIAAMREIIAPFAQPAVNNRGLDVHAGEDAQDKFQCALDGFFLTHGSALKPLRAGTDEYTKIMKGQDPFRSIKEAYVVFTGDELVTGRVSGGQRFTASLDSTSWANVLGSSMNRRLQRDYNLMGLDQWRQLVDITNLADFRQQERVRYGGYGNLPIVNQRAPYAPLTSPTDEKATYTPAKRGGTEDLTREMIKNDDVQSIGKIPNRMARAAAQTLHEFVFDFIRPSVNPTIYDNVALYHADHANTATVALAKASLAAARLRMKKQTMRDNGKRLGIRAGYLLIPADLEETGYGLLTPAFDKNNQVPEFTQQIGIVPIPIDYWTDATDWVLAARREDVVGIEIGFIDGNETPELFVSDLTNAGSFFTNDVITYKIRHEYGGNIVDFRAFDGSVVAG